MPLAEFRQRVIGGYGLVDRPVMGRTPLHDIEPDPLQAALLKLQSLRRTVGKVDNPALTIGPRSFTFTTTARPFRRFVTRT